MSKGGYTAPSPGCSDVARRLLHCAMAVRGRGSPCSTRWGAARARCGRPMPNCPGWLGEVTPDVLDFRRREAELFFRRIGITFAVYGDAEATRAPDPLRHHPAHPLGGRMGRAAARPRAARQGAQRSSSTTSTAGARSSRPAIVPEDLVFQNPVFRPEMNGAERAARHLRAHRRHRHRARRRRRVLRARGQCAHALRRLLHAGEPRDR